MFISRQDAQLYTVDFGSGPRTFVAHGGWTGSWEVWTNTLAALSKTWRVVAYDHRGTGASQAPVEGISVEAMVADLFAVLDTLGIEKCVMGAESAGALTALTAMRRQPQRFEGLVIVDGLYYGATPEGNARFIGGLKSDYEATIGRFVDNCVPATEPNSALVRTWGRKILMRARPESAIRLIESTHGLDLRPDIPHITQPTLVIHGEQDIIVPLSDAEWLAANLPNAHLHIIQGAGHVPTITYPREIASAINEFFARS